MKNIKDCINMIRALYKSRYLYSKLQKCITVIMLICLCALVIDHFATTGIYNYDHIPQDKIPSELYRKTIPNLKKTKPNCNYDNILTSTKRYKINYRDLKEKFSKFALNDITNGSYLPKHCHPEFSVAVLIVYRNRSVQLDIFLPYIHNFLRAQNIHYRIYIIEQRDNRPFNRGALFNIGAKQAIEDQFPCLILQDVDLLPLKEGNLYACTQQPRHMSASIDKFRYALPYDRIAGGVLAIRADQFIEVNGFSNRFNGWGGEDDDLAIRFDAHNLTISRFSRTVSKYMMLVHQQEFQNPDRKRLYRKNHFCRSRFRDGFNTVRYRSVEVKQHRLFTLVVVKLLYVKHYPIS